MTSFATTSTGTRVAYFESGRPWRPALVLTHSLGSDHRMWAPQIEALKSQYYIIAIDNIGHGESAVPSGDYSVADFAEAVIAVADAWDAFAGSPDERDHRATGCANLELVRQAGSHFDPAVVRAWLRVSETLGC